MKRKSWLLLAGLSAASCLMSRLEVGPADGAAGSGAESGEGHEGGAGSGKGGKSAAGGSDEPSGGTGYEAGSGSVIPGAGGIDDAGGAGGSGNPTAGGEGGRGAISGSGGSDSGGAGGDDGGMGGGGSGGGSITDVVPSVGCGNQAPATGKLTLNTSGVKEANCAAKLQDGTPRCGAWGQASSAWRTLPVPRDYYVYLPANYDENKPYTLIILGPGCGGTGQSVYPLENNVDDQAIRVGFSPGPSYMGHGTNPNQGCFDDKEGDDSIDFVFYEAAYDALAANLCFDRNRVFVGGNSTGAFLANELGCKYAGDAQRPIRGVLVNTGGLPTEPAYRPTCSTAPMAGMWIHETGDTTNPFAGNKEAIGRAMLVNGCTIGTSYDTATFSNYPIGGGNPDSSCKQILGCPADYPLVVCPLVGNSHGSHDQYANPGFSTFVKSLLP